MENYVMIGVRESTKNKLAECKKIYLKHHPEFRDMEDKITNNKIIAEMIRFYQETETGLF